MTSLKLLLVEDDLAVRASLQRRLRFEGFLVESVDRGDVAVKRFTELRPDLVLLDLTLPGLHGFSVAQQIRLISDVPILILTALTDLPAKDNPLQDSDHDYLIKPFRFSDMLARVSALLPKA